MLDRARAGGGPALVETLTYRIGAHTSSDDPSKYRSDDELAHWAERDPLLRLRAYLSGQGVGEEEFDRLDAEALDLAADIRRRTVEIADPVAPSMFANVYREPQPLVEAQARWLADYEASFEETS
jgi:pyruvate dehydrogenase E1 component alpha subunit